MKNALFLDTLVANTRNNVQKCLSIWVQWALKEGVFSSKLHLVTQIHDHNSICNVADNREVMADKDIGQTVIFLQLFKQVDYLGLNRNVQSRNRLVADNNFWLKHNSASNTNTLALTARKLMRVAVLELKVKANFLHNLFNASITLCLCLIGACNINRLTNDIHDRHTRVQ